MLWQHWGAEWELDEKVSFNGLTKQITVNVGVTSIDIAKDVYSAWVRWTQRETRFLPAMRYTGYDPIPGGRTGITFFTITGWKLCYDPTVVAVSGVLYSEDYDTAYWSIGGTNAIYPATVSSLVNTVIQTQTVTLAANPSEIAAEILATPVSAPQTSGSLGEFLIKKVLTVAKFIGLK